MQNHFYDKNVVSKILIATLLLCLIIGTSILYIAKYNTSSSSIKKISEHINNKEIKTFYSTIGNSPINQSEPTSKIANENFTIEITVVDNVAEANEMLKTLSAKGINAFYTPFNLEGHVKYKIRYGVFQNKKQAISELQKVDSIYTKNSTVTTL